MSINENVADVTGENTDHLEDLTVKFLTIRGMSTVFLFYF